MKYIFILVVGLAVGVAIFVAGLIYNPFTGNQRLSPLSVTNAETLTLAYSAVPSDSILYTNDGESRVKPHPEKVLQLWEAPIRQTSATTLVLRDARNQVAGIGIKISSTSEKTKILAGEAIVDSIWYAYLPGRGALFISQYENRWSYLQNVVIPAYRSSANTWAGSWFGDITAGPRALGIANVSGGSGEFAGAEMLGVESLTVRAWSVDAGPVASDGRLIIELPAKVSSETE